ncbi:MAG: response regulator [Desertimonas sp.]
MHVLIAADAPWLVDEIVAALGGSDTSFTVCNEGREVAKVLAARAGGDDEVDLAVFDLQIGSMGGMAVTMAMRLDASSGSGPDVPVLMLLDRLADVHLARRSGADGWLVKPLDPLRLRRAARTVRSGDSYQEGLGGVVVVSAAEREGEVEAVEEEGRSEDSTAEPAGQEPAAAG